MKTKKNKTNYRVAALQIVFSDPSFLFEKTKMMSPYAVDLQMKVWRIKVRSQIQTNSGGCWRHTLMSPHHRQVVMPAGSTGQMVRALQEFKEHLIRVLTETLTAATWEERWQAGMCVTVSHDHHQTWRSRFQVQFNSQQVGIFKQQKRSFFLGLPKTIHVAVLLTDQPSP